MLMDVFFLAPGDRASTTSVTADALRRLQEMPLQWSPLIRGRSCMWFPLRAATRRSP